MDRRTNTANLVLSATELLICAGRLREHELWGGPVHRRQFIIEGINEEVAHILRWMAENGLTVVASEDEEAA